MIRSHLHENLFFFTNLISRYASLGSVSYAYRLFSSSGSSRDVFLYNVVIRGLVDNAHYREAMLLYCKMRRLGIAPDTYTFPFVLKACGFLGELGFGVKVHGDVVVFGYEGDGFTANSVVAMYGKCGRFDLCRLVFDKMPQRNVVSWSTVISVCSQNGKFGQGLSLFWEMLDKGIEPNRASILNAMACVRFEKDADDVWRIAVDNGFHAEQSVNSSAIGMYARCGRMDIARRLFDGIGDRDLLTWSAMIEAYAQAELPVEAFGIFNEMVSQNIIPDSVTILSVIRALSVLESFLHARTAMMIYRRVNENDIEKRKRRSSRDERKEA
ncbi:hypothetical protein Tsubulata_039220 [Turnera subulata]|uniref:Pentacotripeptide-repeat region of PRORP domain-containing protein n=1 Tax=Turnera subulata TaxID=218843 RepID=A0A9Q0J0P1_9ROSI|nr:hypothetical protein Tsubulata_039220 [Turnera subulata]